MVTELNRRLFTRLLQPRAILRLLAVYILIRVYGSTAQQFPIYPESDDFEEDFGEMGRKLKEIELPPEDSPVAKAEAAYFRKSTSPPRLFNRLCIGLRRFHGLPDNGTCYPNGTLPEEDMKILRARAAANQSADAIPNWTLTLAGMIGFFYA